MLLLRRRAKARYYFRPPQVEPWFRECVLKALTRRGVSPDDEAILRLVAWRYFGTWRERDTGWMVTPHEMWARLEGVSFNEKRYDPKPFIERASQALGGIEMADYKFISGSLVGGRARAIKRLGCDDEIEPTIQDYLMRKTPQSERVDFVTGKTWNKTSRKVAITDEAAYIAEAISEGAPNPASEFIATYIRSLEAYRETFYAKVNENYFDAHQKLLELYRPDEGVCEEKVVAQKRRHQVQREVLENIITHPVPFVKPAKRTSRLAINIKGYLHLRREAYRELVKGWESFDGKGIQLAIIARLWGIDDLQEFLRSGEYIWARLCEDLGLPLYKKQALKEATYKLFFGARQQTTSNDEQERRAAVEDGLDLKLGDGYGRRFVKLPLIRPIVKARTQIKRQVLRDKGIQGAFGWIPLTWTKKRLDNGNTVDVPEWRSVLAQQAQSYEVAMIAECYKVAAETSDFLIAVYRYDGFTLCWRDNRPERREKWVERLKTAFKAKADEFGIITELVEE